MSKFGSTSGSVEIFSQMSEEEIKFLSTNEPLAKRIRFLAMCVLNWPYREGPFQILIEPLKEVRAMFAQRRAASRESAPHQEEQAAA